MVLLGTHMYSGQRTSWWTSGVRNAAGFMWIESLSRAAGSGLLKY